ncbi:MAG TPA: HAMP domain-containing protein, partial [Turneriella sp.]|nr:HAMP domain-containing protein [Turneriella sp.]
MRVRSKLIIALSLVIAVAIIPISFYIVNKFEHSSFQKAKEEGEAQSQFFVRSVFNLLLTNGGNIPATRVDAKEVLKIFEGQKAQGLVAMKAIFLSRDKENNGSTLASWPHWIEKESVTELPPTYALRACSDHPQNRCMVFSANMGLSDEAPSLLVSLEYAEAVVLAPIQELKQNLLFAVVIALMLVLILAVLLGFQMTKPLKILEKGTRELAKGNLTYTVALERADEFGELARSFNFMVTSLNRHIEELKEKDRELNAAQTIQRAFLPETLPQSASIGFAAHFTPMAQVGGDLYDVFETGEGYGILIADVSGHGVPAALITGMAK